MIEIIWDMSMVILTYKADITGHVTKRNKKKMKGKNTTESRNGSWFNFDKFITGYETCCYKNSLQNAKC